MWVRSAVSPTAPEQLKVQTRLKKWAAGLARSGDKLRILRTPKRPNTVAPGLAPPPIGSSHRVAAVTAIADQPERIALGARQHREPCSR